MLQLTARDRKARAPVGGWQTIDTAEAVIRIPDGAAVAVEWLSDSLAAAIGAAYTQRGRPRNLTLVYATAPGPSRGAGVDRLVQPGLARRVISGQWSPAHALQALTAADGIEGYSLPAGVI